MNPGGQQNAPQTWPVGQHKPFIQVVPGGQQAETPPLPAMALHTCPVGQQTPATQVVPGAQQLKMLEPAVSPPMQI
jgi:hypothetical protein